MKLNHGNQEDYTEEGQGQMFWDEYQTRFEQVVALAEQVVGLSDSGDGQSSKNIFTLDFGIVGALYDTARICRDPYIRRRAIDTLRRYRCREGLWDGTLAARVANRFMELEESQASVPNVQTAADIPVEARISTVIPTFHFEEHWAILDFKKNVQWSRPSTPDDQVVVAREILSY